MKRGLLFMITCLLFIFSSAQVPQGISHQAVIRDAGNNLVANADIGIRVSILQESIDGIAVYVETHIPRSNANGLITYVIGHGVVVEGDFEYIDWGEDIFFLKTEADPAGGTDYSITGTTQFHSVPFSFHSRTSNAAKSIDGSISSNIQPPAVVISPVTEIEQFTATLNGVVNGEGFLTNVLFEWGTTTSYGNTIEAVQSPVRGSSDLNVSTHLSNLSSGTTYHYRIRASNAVDVVYSEDASFTTEMSIPQITTSAVTSITPFSAISGGNITHDGGSPVTGRGVVWSTTENPTVDNNEGITSDGTVSESFVSEMTGLFAGTSYYVRAYAVNNIGTAYGNQMSFTTLGQVPTVTTSPASEITISSVMLNGVVNANHLETTVVFEYGLTTDYGSIITATQSPVTGTSNTNVSASVEGLSLGTTYYFRTKAENELGISYGNQQSFTTLGQLPTAQTDSVSGITNSNALLVGRVNANHLETTVMFEYGPTTEYGSIIIAQESPVSGSSYTWVNASIEGLTLGTTYYFRVKAENELGVSYGEPLSFKTTITGLTGTVTDNEGNVYNTIGIGHQEWMAENLRYLPEVVGPGKGSETETVPYYYVYGYNGTDVNAAKTTDIYQNYGVLYNWIAALNACPPGWHLPSDSEWSQLVDFVVAQGYPNAAGSALKSCYQVNSPLEGLCSTSDHPRWDEHPSRFGTDDFGFSVLPGGLRQYDGLFYGLGYYGTFWSATEDSLTNAWYWYLQLTYDAVFNNRYYKSQGFSVRCVKE